MGDIADRAAELQERANEMALRERRLPAHMRRGNPICGVCGGTNDRPQYARCSDCVYDPGRPKPEPDLVTCESCRFVALSDVATDGLARCTLGQSQVQGPRGVVSLWPSVGHFCPSWEQGQG